MQQDNLVIPFEYEHQLYLVQQVTPTNVLRDYADFFYEGWQQLCDPHKAKADITWEAFLQIILRTAQNAGPSGEVFIIKSKNQKLLGFLVIIEDTEYVERRTALIYAAYSNSKDFNASKAGIEFIARWAKQMHYVELHAQSRRINGAAMRYFRKKLGFVPLSIVFGRAL